MTFTGTLLEKMSRTADTVSLRFSRPAEYVFQAGQHYSVTLTTPQGSLTHRFSHADSPTESFTELTTRLTGSPFKQALDALPLGGTAAFEGPFGHFLFRYQEPRLAFLTGGVGITPVRSMLRYLADTGGTGRVEGQEIVVFYGCMTQRGLIYGDEIEQFARVLPGLRVVYVITDPTEDWNGRSGFITAEVVAQELDDPSRWLYYVVGPPPMMTAMDKVTGQLEIPGAQIVKESFAGYTS